MPMFDFENISGKTVQSIAGEVLSLSQILPVYLHLGKLVNFSNFQGFVFCTRLIFFPAAKFFN